LSAIDAEEERLMLVPPSNRGSPPAFREISIAEILKQARASLLDDIKVPDELDCRNATVDGSSVEKAKDVESRLSGRGLFIRS
jgi:hypothetical protein